MKSGAQWRQYAVRPTSTRRRGAMPVSAAATVSWWVRVDRHQWPEAVRAEKDRMQLSTFGKAPWRFEDD